MGLFIPFDPMPPKETNLTQWQIVQDIIDNNVMINSSKADNLLVFLLNVLSCIGMVILIIYTAYGMSSLPFSMINGQRTVYTDRNSVEKEIEDLGKFKYSKEGPIKKNSHLIHKIHRLSVYVQETQIHIYINYI